mmetsp:Transcript_9737/g.27345  ORF Transcript_9737/g.27345 Transcript_9737/m.27345 type:complete len:216 (-) Transcript_9737:1198-1845(-)
MRAILLCSMAREFRSKKLNRVQSQIQLINVMLRKIAHLQFGVGNDVSFLRGQPSCQKLQHGRLAGTVGANKRYTTVHVEREVEIFQNFWSRRAVGKRHSLELNEGARDGLRLRKGKRHGRIFRNRRNQFHSLENLDSTLGQGSPLGIKPPSVNKTLDMLSLSLLRLVRPFLVLELLHPGHLKLLIVARIRFQCPVEQMDDVCCKRVDEGPRMRNG